MTTNLICSLVRKFSLEFNVIYSCRYLPVVDSKLKQVEYIARAQIARTIGHGDAREIAGARIIQRAIPIYLPCMSVYRLSVEYSVTTNLLHTNSQIV